MSILARIDRSLEFPAALSPLIGREREVAALRSLVKNADIRLITLTGPGGVGKTRLALGVASGASGEFPDGRTFVDLALVNDPDLVATAIELALGASELANPRPAERLKRALGGQRRLLLLDNFEQVVAAASLLPELLKACPNLTIIVTSRRTLRVTGEHEFTVQPLAVPSLHGPVDIATLTQWGSIALFVARARATRADFTLTAANGAVVAEICARLDGLPLAIELAAARSKVLSPAALLARLTDRLRLLADGPRDAPARLQTMRSAIAWSYDLLDPTSQSLFRQCCVFAGGFTLEAAEAACELDEERLVECRVSKVELVLDGVASLVDQSLVQPGEQTDGSLRFRILETIREFGWSRVIDHGEAEALHRRHAAWCVALAERAHPEAYGPSYERLLDQLELERANLRAAMTWATKHQDAVTSLRLACGLWLFWLMRNSIDEGRRWFERALAGGSAAPPALRARGMAAMGGLALTQGDIEQAAEVGNECLALFQEAGDDAGVAQALQLLGVTAQARGDDARAIEMLESATLLYSAAPAEPWSATALAHLALSVYRQGNPERAAKLCLQGMEMKRQLRHRWPPSFVMPTLGQVASDSGDAVTAARWYGALLADPPESHSSEELAEALAGLASVAGVRPDRVARLAGAAETLRPAAKLASAPYGRAAFERAIAAARNALGEAAFAAAWAAGRNLPLERTIAEAAQVASSVIHPVAPIELQSDGPHLDLTVRERQVLRLIATGQTDRQIAFALSISPRTVTNHVVSILAKLDLPNRAAAAAYAAHHGLD